MVQRQIDHRAATTALVCILASCHLNQAELEVERRLPADFAVTLATRGPIGPVTEVHAMRRGAGLCVRVRVSSAESAWPPLFDRVLRAQLDGETAGRLAAEIERSGFFDLPAIVESRSRALPAPVVLRVRAHGRSHQVVARGRALPGFTTALTAVLDSIPACLDAFPAWTHVARGDTPARAPQRDLAAAIRFHEDWLAEQPARRSLHLDLFALRLTAGQLEAAALDLEQLRSSPVLSRFLPSLWHRLRSVETGADPRR